MIDQPTFTNSVRSLFNIDGWMLPELTGEQQGQFIRDPVRYFIGTDKAQQDAIFREVVKRQRWDVRGAGWRPDCPKCVGSKFTCDDHFVARGERP